MKKILSAAVAAAMLMSASPAVIYAADSVPAVQIQAQTAIDPFDSAYSVIVNAATLRAIAVENSGTENLDKIVTVDVPADIDNFYDSMVWRVSPIGGDMYCAVNKNSGRSLDVPDALKDDGVQLIQYSYNGNAQQKMTFEKSGEAYTIKPSHADTYLADQDGKLVQISDKTASEAQWVLLPIEESIMRRVAETPGYALLADEQKRAFDNYFFSKMDMSRSVRNSAETLLANNDYLTLSAEAQKELLITALTYTASGQVVGDVVNETPAKYTIVKAEQVPDYDIWRGSRTTCWVYDVEMDGDVEGQVHKFQFISNEADKDAPMVTKAIEAIGVFPYALRQHVHKLYWKSGDTANSYNGGGNEIWIRLTWEPTRQQISQTLSHELGHVLEQNMLQDPDVWSLAERLDATPISSYGSSNETEDLAEFSRTYWTNLGKDTFDELEKVYPNRLKIFKGLLYRADKEYFANYAEYEKFIDELTAQARAAGSDSDNSGLDEKKLYKIVDPVTDRAFTVRDNSTDNDVPLTLEQFTWKPGQIFSIEKYGNMIKIISNNSGKPIQLDDSALSGKTLAQYGGTWAIDEKFAVYENDGLFRLMAPRYQLYAAPFNNNVGQTIEAYGWKFVEIGDSDVMTAKIRTGSNALTSGESVEQVTAVPDGSTWKISPAEEKGTVKIINTETGLSLDILDSSTDEGAALITYDYYGSANQLFVLEETVGGTKIKNVNSGLYLNVEKDGSVTQRRSGTVFTIE